METRSTRRHDFTTHLEFRKFAVLVVLLFVVSFCSQERSVFLVTSNHTKILLLLLTEEEEEEDEEKEMTQRSVDKVAIMYTLAFDDGA